MQRYLLLLVLLSLPLAAAQNPPRGSDATAAGVSITAEQWARPRHGERIARLPGLGALVEAVDHDAASRLVIRFASGDEGALWAEELRSWLVALGVPSARIVLEPGWPSPDALRLERRTSPPR
jgi:hypothetical protein